MRGCPGNHLPTVAFQPHSCDTCLPAPGSTNHRSGPIPAKLFDAGVRHATCTPPVCGRPVQSVVGNVSVHRHARTPAPVRSFCAGFPRWSLYWRPAIGPALALLWPCIGRVLAPLLASSREGAPCVVLPEASGAHPLRRPACPVATPVPLVSCLRRATASPRSAQTWAPSVTTPTAPPSGGVPVRSFRDAEPRSVAGVSQDPVPTESSTAPAVRLRRANDARPFSTRP